MLTIYEKIKKFCLDFCLQDGFDDSGVIPLLDYARETLNLRAVYVLEAFRAEGRFVFSYISEENPQLDYTGELISLDNEEFSQLLSMYDDDNVCSSNRLLNSEWEGSVMEYGFFSKDSLCGCLVFCSGNEHLWTSDEREALIKLGRALQTFLYAAYSDSRVEAKFINTITRFFDNVFNVCIWENRCEPVKLNEDFNLIYSSSGGIYSAMVAQYIDEYVDPSFQADISYRLSAEYIFTHLTSENPRFHVDYQHSNSSNPFYYRIHVMLLDTTPEGLANNALIAVQDITTRTKSQDLNDVAFSLMLGGYCRIAFVDLNNNSMTTIQAGPGEPVSKYSVGRYVETLQEIAEKTVPPEFRETMQSFMSPNYLYDVFEKGSKSVEFSYERVIDGKRSWVRSEVVPLADYAPGNARVMWYVRDISADEAHKYEYLENLLRANKDLTTALSYEKQYRMALMADSYFYFTFDVSGDGLIKDEFLSSDGINIIKLTTKMELPVPFETFCQKWYELYHPVFDKNTETDVFTIAYLRDAFLRNERIIDVEVKQSPPEGSGATEFMEIYIVLSEDEMTGHIMACVIWKDISEFRRMELQTRIVLKEAYEAAEQASRAKSEFLSRMSHDIRTPMNAIIGMTSIAKVHINDPERVADCLQKINVSSAHLLSLINEVLDMSKIESGKMDLNEEAFNLSVLIDSLSQMMRPQMLAKHHKFNIQINNVEHEEVIGDSLRLQQAFVNFIGNSVKYTPVGGCIDLIITEKPCRQPQFACFEFVFQDNGIGMSPEFVERIFEPFSRAEDTRINKIQGTGLGMAITNNLIHMMNGDIKVESTLGKGSRFIVKIFLRCQETQTVSYDEFHKLSVLIADGSKANCEAACGLLTEMEIKNEWVMNAYEVLEKVSALDLDNDDYYVIILDWDMQDMDSCELTRKIKSISKRPIVIASSYDCPDIELEACDAGADAFISKPLFKSRFEQLFHEILNESGESAARDEHVRDIAEQDFHGKRILLVEDNDLNTEIATEILGMANLDVEHAENGERALEMFKASDLGYYDLIFMDIQMPVMNGYEAAKAIRALAREDAADVPIVAMTANAFTEDVEAALKAGMNGHIAKPLDFGQLINILNRWLTA